MSWIDKMLGVTSEEPQPPVDHGRADVYKPGDQLLCIAGHPGMGLTEGKVYLVPYLPSATAVPVYNDYGGISLAWPDRFKLHA